MPRQPIEMQSYYDCQRVTMTPKVTKICLVNLLKSRVTMTVKKVTMTFNIAKCLVKSRVTMTVKKGTMTLNIAKCLVNLLKSRVTMTVKK